MEYRSASARIRIICLLIVSLIATGCSLLPAGKAAKPEDDRPNFVVIFVDDLGYNDVSYNGAVEIETPNIDRLAEKGVIFSSGYVVHPFCGPSRAGLITGRYPARFGMEYNVAYAPLDAEHGLPVEEKTMATYLKEAGYRTGIVGKWQLGAAPAFHPLNRGFDYFYGFLGGAHDYFRIDITRPGTEYLPLNENRGATGMDGYLTDALTDRAVSFIQERREEPFFLYLAYNAPHTPLQAPEGLVDKYSHVENENRRLYLAMVDSLDKNVGQVLDALEQSDVQDDTVVFFLSDNGGVSSTVHTGLDWADNAPLRTGKESFFEGGIRVPFIASWPAEWPSGMTFEPMISSLDIAATAVALSRSVPDPDRPLDGVNLDPFIRGEKVGEVHKSLFWRQSSRTPGLTKFAIRAGDAKLVKDDPKGEAKLFNLAQDPGETDDLIGTDIETAARLADLWNAWNRDNIQNIYPEASHYEAVKAEAVQEFTEGYESSGKEEPIFQVGIAPEPYAASCSNGIVVPSPEHNLGLVRDCEGLMMVRDVLVGGTDVNWTYDEPLLNWNHVTVGGDPNRVRELEMPSRGFEGSISPGLGNLNELIKLNLHSNQLTGAIPTEIGNLAKLRELRLGNNRLTGSVPEALADLENLELIRLNGNLLTGCIPASLQNVDNDFDEDGLPFCGVAGNS